MEIILAVVMASAVIFFGALISMGNERQRRAIDGLREQVVLWAVQDLKIKREHLAQTVQVPDPINWVNKVVTRVYGQDLNLKVVEVFENPHALLCNSQNDGTNVVFTSFSPTEIKALKRAKKNRLLQIIDGNPLLLLPRNAAAFEFSILNSGILFDLELPLAWKGLTGNDLDEMNSIWMYLRP
ncbi:hypothetical protein [Candidatus Villigracilis affinis]|uniref:hypothetical protein n=1 Tax=Candidatus Villigracilis affinis TaxID=3140682 RepID=UPI001DA6DA2F|nr:hypothetical protein [Anaerolineales bacterium]